MIYKNFEVDKNKYKLEKVFALSRHNIRSPLTGGDSLLSKVTNHQWFDWTSKDSELSLRGEQLQEKMGQYYRKYLLDKGFMDSNWIPNDQEARIYANSLQRTIYTAKAFAKGLFEENKVDVEYHMDIGVMDPVFDLIITFYSDSYYKQILKEIDENVDLTSLKDTFKLLEQVLDYDSSIMAKTLPHFDPFDYKYILENMKEPAMTGSLRIAMSAADALKLQYYEDEDNYRAGFNHDLSVHEWLDLCEIVDVYCNILYGMPSIAINIANPLLKEMYSELKNDSRKLTFFCGHDSNIYTTLGALGVKDYLCPKTYERKTPMGGAILIEKWMDIDTKKEYYSICLVYQSLYQLEEIPNLELDKAPVKYHLSFNNLNENEDGLVLASDFETKLLESINAYDKLKKQYCE